MTTQNLALFKALGAKMDFLNQRQRVIAQNVANADTPSYRPKDLKPVDFSQVLKNVTGEKNVTIRSTNAGHMPKVDEIRAPDPRKQKETYEVAPAGNAVIIEEQLFKSGANIADYNLMTNLYQKNIGMLRIAIGRN